MFIEAMDDGGGGDNCIIGAISRAKLQSNHQQQTNIQPRVISGEIIWLNKKNINSSSSSGSSSVVLLFSNSLT